MKAWMVFISILLAGCSLTPEFRKPEIDLPSSLKLDKGMVETHAITPEWWKRFNDPLLDKLIEDALKNNDDLMIALSRIEQAGAILGMSSAELYPLLTGSASFLRSDASNEIKNHGGTGNMFMLSAMASYEIDLWDRLRNSRKADLMRFLATKSARDTIEIGIVSNVASTYFNLISIERQIATANEIMERLREIYELRQKQFNHGLIDELTLEQSKAEYESTNLLIETLKAQREGLMSTLSVLLGRSPREIFENRLEVSEKFPEPLALPSMLPSELLERRPDIISAEDNLRAANYEIGVARASYFPRIFLTGSGGFQSNELRELISSSATFWNLGANLTGTLLDFGRTKNYVMLREAQKKEALFQYVKTVRNAFKEVYDAIMNFEQSIKRLDAQKAQLQSLERVYLLAEKRYERGLTDYITVLDSQRSYLNARLNLIRLETEVINNQVFLYRALGGGWEDNNER